MKQESLNRSRIIGLRLTPKEYEQIEKKWKATTCRKLSYYVRKCLFEKPVVATYRNQSFDDFMTEMMKLRNELNAVGNNFNQAVKKLYSLQQIQEFRTWIFAYEKEHEKIHEKVSEIKNHLNKIADKWLP